jgi:hypothetical protein
MKKLYALLFTAFCITALHSQVVFQSNFSQWTGNTPDGWVGSKTNFAPDSIVKDTVGSQFGGSSVRLINSTSSHKRFSTQPVPVAEGDTFEIRYWAKGKADVRFGIFDNNLSTANFGYHYASYISINDTAWTMYSQTVTADTTNNAAEFILSIRNTDSTAGHIQFDSVAIMFALPLPPQAVTITAIQGGVSTSPYNNQTVTTKGVVTGYATYKHPTDPNKDYRSYFIQDGDSAWSGIWVSDTVNYLNVASGDTVLITGQVEEFFGYTRIKNVTSFVNIATGPQPVPVMVSTQEANDEKYEGVLVEVTNAVVIDVTDIAFGNFAVNDGSDTLEVDDIMYGPSTDPQLNDVLQLRGCMFYSFATRYLLPRKPSDFTWLSSVEEKSAGSEFHIYPNPNNGTFTIYFPKQFSEKGSVRIYNMLGELVYFGRIASEYGRLDLNSGLSEGIYFVKIDTGRSVETRKMIVGK